MISLPRRMVALAAMGLALAAMPSRGATTDLAATPLRPDSAQVARLATRIESAGRVLVRTRRDALALDHPRVDADGLHSTAPARPSSLEVPPRSIPWELVRELRVPVPGRGFGVGRGVLVGFLAGTALGVAMVALDDCSSDVAGGCGQTSLGFTMPFVGGVVGALLGRDRPRWEPIYQANPPDRVR